MKTLYVSDLDGTLFDSGGHLSDFTRDTLNELIASGMNFTVATARSVSSAAGLLDDLDLKVPAVMMNGVFLTDVPNQKQVYVNRYPAELAYRVINVFRSNGRPPFVYSFNGEYIECEFTKLKNDYERQFVAKRQKLYRRFEKVEDYTVGNSTVYINGIDYKETMQAVADELKKIEGIKFSHYLDTYSGDKYFVEVYVESAGKWNSIKRLKEMYGFDRVVAFGDNGNDVEMLKNADLAVVVGNALPPALEVADIVIDTNDNDGVAKYLLDLYREGKL
ncbi:MAG: HAD family hydrolase [Clostridia bacterium]|nr:HAD family hydrolase [Clostridia bacterium]